MNTPLHHAVYTEKPPQEHICPTVAVVTVLYGAPRRNITVPAVFRAADSRLYSAARATRGALWPGA